MTSRVYCPPISLARPSIRNAPSGRAVAPFGKVVEPSFDHDIVAPVVP